MSILTDLASLRQAFWRLTATDQANPALTEHEATTNATVDQFLQYGAWDAQNYLIDLGLADRWVTLSSALTWSGADLTDGGRYSALPSDFLRLRGDENHSALRVPGTKRWGYLIPSEYCWEAQGDFYWLMNDALWIAYGAQPPSGLKMDYHHKLADLAVGTTVDFPSDHMALIPAYACTRAMNDAWLPGGLEMRAGIQSALNALQKEAARRVRRTRMPRTMRTVRTRGATHW
jgi:hypothetical protein